MLLLVQRSLSASSVDRHDNFSKFCDVEKMTVYKCNELNDSIFFQLLLLLGKL